MKPRSSITELVNILENYYQLPQNTRLSDFWEKKKTVTKGKKAKQTSDHPKRSFLAYPSFRVDHHFDPKPHLLILDQESHVIGLVYEVSKDDAVNEVAEAGKGVTDEKIDESLNQCVRGLVDRAAYLRHLLVKAKGSFSYMVELVIVSDESLSKNVGNLLRELIRKTEYLYAAGVNVLHYRHEGDQIIYPRSQHARAFSWLLHHTRQWYAKELHNEPRQLRKIHMKNYRLPGTRTLKLSEKRQVHVIHGHNGSGKSTLAEALELAITGKAKRLSAAEDVAQVIKNLHTQGDLELSLVYTKGDDQQNPHSRSFKIGKEGVENPLASGLDINAFRLDQPLMDRLTTSGSTTRALTFVRAFFPGEADTVKAFEEAATTRQKAIDLLPEHLQEEVVDVPEMIDGVKQRFGWLRETGPIPDQAAIEDCLPVSLLDLEALAALQPSIPGAIEEWPGENVKDLDRILDLIDAIVEDLSNNRSDLENTLDVALGALRMANAWQAGETMGLTRREYESALNRWLSLTALCGLANQAIHLLETLHAARGEDWQDDQADQFFASLGIDRFDCYAENRAELDRQRTNWERERDRRFGMVKQFNAEQFRDTRSETGEPVHLSLQAIEALNTVGHWLEQPELGEKVQTALSTGDHVPLKSGVTVGDPGWADRFIDRLEQIKAAFSRFSEGLDTEPYLTGNQLIWRYRDLLRKHDAYQDQERALRDTFLRGLHSTKGQVADDPSTESDLFLRALNELMALFTPARWAFSDIQLVYEVVGGETMLRMESGGKKNADLRLNTAELNLFTLALFFLCGPRKRKKSESDDTPENPLSLLVMDDPLQNMDELTVTALARGLSRVIPLWPKNWQLIMFFHGRGDLERFRAEVPSAVYFLPWLRPSASGDEEKTIPPEPLDQKEDVSLEELFRQI